MIVYYNEASASRSFLIGQLYIYMQFYKLVTEEVVLGK